ncbi:MAG: glycosyltransferase, partial [Gammaproteobacteria bacterium]|nr:glycosyltransferase [Gammaproteobacteria bacterium]
ERGVECSILVLRNREPVSADEWYIFDDVPVHRFHTRPFVARNAITDVFDWRMYNAMCSEISCLKPDIVHITNVSGSTLAPYLACRAKKTPVVNTLHDLWLLCPNNMLYRQDGSFCRPNGNRGGCRQCLRRYDYWGAIPARQKVFAKMTSNVRYFISPSQALIDRHLEAGYDRNRFRLVRYGVGPDIAIENSDPVVQEIFDTRSKFKTIVFGGGGIEIKGSQVVRRAIPLLLDRIAGLRIIIAGGGDLLDEFRGLGEAVRVLGKVPFQCMRQLFAAADLVLLPSVWHENLPVVIFESHQSGTPIVGSNFGGIPEIVEHEKTGYLFSTGNEGELAECVVKHFSRPTLERRRMRQECYRNATENLTFERHINGIQQVYGEALTI